MNCPYGKGLSHRERLLQLIEKFYNKSPNWGLITISSSTAWGES